MGVTKGVLGSPEIVQSYLDAGIEAIGDSRVDNIQRIRQHFPRIEITFLRNPTLGEIDKVVDLADVSFNTEIGTIRKLNDVSREAGKFHRVMISVEMGDMREGVLIGELPALLREIDKLENIVLDGLACNFSCISGKGASAEALLKLLAMAEKLSDETGVEIKAVSGGNSSALPLVENGSMPTGVSQLRFGEAILLGRVPPFGTPVEGAHKDAFVIRAEVVEVAGKPDGSGKKEKRAVLAIGKQDIVVDGLSLSNGFCIKGASSDNLILGLGEANLKVGDEVLIYPNYDCLLRAMTSPFVNKEYLN